MKAFEENPAFKAKLPKLRFLGEFHSPGSKKAFKNLGNFLISINVQKRFGPRLSCGHLSLKFRYEVAVRPAFQADVFNTAEFLYLKYTLLV